MVKVHCPPSPLSFELRFCRVEPCFVTGTTKTPEATSDARSASSAAWGKRRGRMEADMTLAVSWISTACATPPRIAPAASVGMAGVAMRVVREWLTEVKASRAQGAWGSGWQVLGESTSTLRRRQDTDSPFSARSTSRRGKRACSRTTSSGAASSGTSATPKPSSQKRKTSQARSITALHAGLCSLTSTTAGSPRAWHSRKYSSTHSQPVG